MVFTRAEVFSNISATPHGSLPNNSCLVSRLDAGVDGGGAGVGGGDWLAGVAALAGGAGCGIIPP